MPGITNLTTKVALNKKAETENKIPNTLHFINSQ